MFINQYDEKDKEPLVGGRNIYFLNAAISFRALVVMRMALFERIQPAIVFDEEESLSKAISEIARSGTCVVVTKNGKYHGIIDDACIRQLPSDPSSTKAINFAVNAPGIDANGSLLEACEKFLNNANLKALPLVDGETIIGVATLADLLSELRNINAVRKGRVGDAMDKAETIEQNESVSRARALMRDTGAKKLVVTMNGKLVGVISNFDLNTVLSKPKDKPPFVREKAGISEQPVFSLVREHVEIVSPDDSLGKAAELMASKNISNIVVAEKGTPVGIITAVDILKTVVGEAEKIPIEIMGLEAEEREHVSRIRGYCEKTLDKIAKTQQVECLKLNIKKISKSGERHRYTVIAQLQTDKPLNVSYYDWDLLKAVHGALDEVKKAMAKKKDSPMHGETGYKKEQAARRKK